MNMILLEYGSIDWSEKIDNAEYTTEQVVQIFRIIAAHLFFARNLG